MGRSSAPWTPGHPAGDPGGGGGGHQGEEGTWLTLEVEAADGTRRTVELQRKQVHGITAAWKLLEDQVGLVTIQNFYAGTADLVKQGGGGAPGPGARALVFDVRNNPGDMSPSSRRSWMTCCPRENFHQPEFRREGDGLHLRRRLCGPAHGGAGEQEQLQRGGVLGRPAPGVRRGGGGREQTSGKGFSQVLFDLPDGSAIGLSTARYYTGGGVSLIGTGLTPDPRAPCRRRMSRSCWPGSWSPRRTNSCRRPFRPWRSEGPVRPAGRGPFPGGKPGEPCDFPGENPVRCRRAGPSP